MTTFVEQKTSHDCVIAAVSMATNKPYDEVMEAAVYTNKDEKKNALYKEGEGTYGTSELLKRLGLEHRGWKEFNGDFASLYVKESSIRSEHYKSLLWGRRSLLSVPSLNIPGGLHMIYYDGDTLHDPNPTTRKRYEKFADIEEIESVIILKG